ncbi:hypothetical protein JZ751_005444 [Albula glossodonta]|uniref:Uncharacterized protein n=1 Tax=Albula glossodonta TaxID=121402 RepID=A0A8T2N5J4_9TELE|nr:hypothetical protein JZ751_005444 [Albula glossodonta]
MRMCALQGVMGFVVFKTCLCLTWNLFVSHPPCPPHSPAANGLSTISHEYLKGSYALDLEAVKQGASNLPHLNKTLVTCCKRLHGGGAVGVRVGGMRVKLLSLQAPQGIVRSSLALPGNTVLPQCILSMRHSKAIPVQAFEWLPLSEPRGALRMRQNRPGRARAGSQTDGRVSNATSPFHVPRPRLQPAPPPPPPRQSGCEEWASLTPRFPLPAPRRGFQYSMREICKIPMKEKQSNLA